jgi:hypothetical protein
MFQCKRTTLGAFACLAVLVAAPGASAQSAAQSGYSEPSGAVQQQVGHVKAGPRASRVEPKENAGLPFTGFDLGLVGAAGGVLLLVGLAVRRLAGSQTP